jgi:chromosomal replication initiation ATPase DnaA
MKYNSPETRKGFILNILSKNRSRPVVEARAVIALLAVDCTRHILKEVSQYLGREISTMSRQVINFRNKINKFSGVQAKIEGSIAEITRVGQGE